MTSPRQFDGQTLIIASHNDGKVGEIAALLRPWCRTIKNAKDTGVAEPVEDGLNYEENAQIKAVSAARATGIPALADDSGFEVRAIGNAPGLYSARWAREGGAVPEAVPEAPPSLGAVLGGAGVDKDFARAMDRVWAEFTDSGSSDRFCRFICALALAWPDGHCETVRGVVQGTLIWPPRGEHGFGYDPIFAPEGSPLSFAEMAPADKHNISHRAKAFEALITRCFPSILNG